MRYLFGDSTESGLELNYLAFLRDVVDCAVVILEGEGTLAANAERRRAREQETAGLIRAVEELGKEAAALVDPVVKEQPKTPAGRCAASIATAIRAAVERESAQARTELATECEPIDQENARVRAATHAVLEKLLRAHDLPGAEKEYEITWNGGPPKATMRERTSFGVEAVIALDVTTNPLLVSDVRVDKIHDLAVHTQEAGGWLKKADKVVKLGRYQVIGVSAGADTTIRIRATPDANAPGFIVTVRKSGDLVIQGTGTNAGKDFTVDDNNQSAFSQFADNLAAALAALDQRTALVSAELDGKPLAEHEHPRVLAERLISAVAPTVQKIVRHGRNPGELVLRRQLANDRREEIFIPISELLDKLKPLPVNARTAFAPLQLEQAAGLPPVIVPPAASPPVFAPPPLRDSKPSEPPPPREAQPSELPPVREGRSTEPPKLREPKASEPPLLREKPKTAPPQPVMREESKPFQAAVSRVIEMEADAKDDGNATE